jgi:carbonic anhydrase/acetyltransferase-like protein (isoleucine patch superfamily)
MPDLQYGRVEPVSGGPIYAFDGKLPQLAPDAFVAPTAAVIGDVTLGAQSSVWFHCVLRGDTSFIRVGARTNIQDGTIVHLNENEPTQIGDDVSIGHAAIIHACTLMNHSFVGMGATVLDRAVIEEGGMLGAGGLLPPGKRIPANELWVGNPARKVRVMTAEERARLDLVAVHYSELAVRFRAGLRATG